MGSSGVAPLTIISHSSDIVQHYADLILSAEREIFFTTNVWEASEASRHISNAIRRLSNQVMDRGGDKIVMKLSKSCAQDQTFQTLGMLFATLNPTY